MVGSRLGLLLLLLGVPPAGALHPHQLAILVDGNQAESIHTGLDYARWRGVPAENIVYVDLPPEARRPEADLSPEDFERHIWKPAWQQLNAHGSAPHILAWAYSSGFPAAISTRPGISLHGLTFSRNRLPDLDAVKQGQLASPLFAGPAVAGGPQRPVLGLDRLPGLLADMEPAPPMPLPAMSLGFDGARGLPAADIRRHLQRTATADGTGFSGTFHFVAGADIRTRARAWQVPAVEAALRAKGFAVEVSEQLPAQTGHAAGVFTGAQRVAPHFRQVDPGGFADHLTSFAATFSHDASQDKLTLWLAAGFAASAGTVAEPFALWQKFPHARTHLMLTEGATMLEALYQGIGCPWQTYLVGDPLVAPGAQPPEWDVVEQATDTELRWQITGTNLLVQTLVNGRAVSTWKRDSQVLWPRAEVPDGTHVVRIVAAAADALGSGSWKEFTVHGRTPGPRIVAPDRVRWPEAFQVAVPESADPASLALFHGSHRLDLPYQTGRGWRVDPQVMHLPPGPLTLHAVQLRGPNETVPGPRLTVELVPTNRPPTVRIAPPTREAKQVHLPVQGADPDGDPVEARLFVDLAALAPERTAGGGKTADQSGGLKFRPNPGEDHLLWTELPDPGDWQRLYLRLRWGSEEALPRHQETYLLFGARDPDNTFFAGFNGREGAWEMGTFTEGVKRTFIRVGRAQWLHQAVDLELIRDPEGGLVMRVDGNRLGRFAGPVEQEGTLGLLKRCWRPLHIERFGVQWRDMRPTPGGGWTFPEDRAASPMLLRVDDGQSAKWIRVPMDQ